MTAFATRLRTFAAIGPANGLRVLRYRLALKLGVHPAQRIAAETIPPGRFFAGPTLPPLPASAPTRWDRETSLFGTYRLPLGDGPPSWTIDPLADGDACDAPAEALAAWWRIEDFAAGDIKRVWEYSRFDWAMAFAQRARNGDAAWLDRLNDWIVDWAARNPAYRGPNWKCAQEASIRLLHLSVAALILGQERPMPPPLRALIDTHVRRIRPTLSYARAQDNNHATSEAAALFVAGAWLGMAGDPDAAALERRGRTLLERQVARLFARDGSFSQYSLNYHRLALDTLSLAEVWRRRAELPAFDQTFRDRAAAGADWLRAMVEETSGDAPNLGANDGANLLPLTDADYRDFRPAAQLATALFRDRRAFDAGPWDEALAWLGVPAADRKLEIPATVILDDGGYAVLRHGGAMALLRYPRFRFRPSQADVLHVDLWRQGENLLRDGGSYSYNTEPCWIDYFGGAASHNTVMFDDQPQMPRLSRFLLGDWLWTEDRGPIHLAEGQGFYAAYRHRRGWSHRREVRLGAALTVIDAVSGFERRATLRWRLSPGAWTLSGDVATNGDHRLSISADVPIVSAAIVAGHESRRYLERTELPVLEVVIAEAGSITSEYRWTR